MESVEAIENKIKSLIQLMLTDGVQPSDLGDNIFFDDYTSIKYEKINGQVVGSVTFQEEFNFKKVTTTLRYFYDQDKRVIRIEEIINRRKKILWDRTKKENDQIMEIISLMKQYYSNDQIQCFVKTLPCSLQSRLKDSLKTIKAS